MPWDGTELWLAEIADDGSLQNQRLIAGSESESIFQPEWSPDGLLYFVSDRTGWWNLYRFSEEKVEAIHPKEAEFGLPQWGFRMTTYGFASAERIICTYLDQGIAHLASIETKTGELTEIETPYTRIDGIDVSPDRAVFTAASPTEMTAIVADCAICSISAAVIVSR